MGHLVRMRLYDYLTLTFLCCRKFDVSRPQHIELPRSLVEVVVHWNIPMHVFLKNCKCFEFLKGRKVESLFLYSVLHYIYPTLVKQISKCLQGSRY